MNWYFHSGAWYHQQACSNSSLVSVRNGKCKTAPRCSSQLFFHKHCCLLLRLIGCLNPGDYGLIFDYNNMPAPSNLRPDDDYLGYGWLSNPTKVQLECLFPADVHNDGFSFTNREPWGFAFRPRCSFKDFPTNGVLDWDVRIGRIRLSPNEGWVRYKPNHDKWHFVVSISQV